MTVEEKYEALASFPCYAEAAWIYWKVTGRSDLLPPPTPEELKRYEAEAVAELEKMAKSLSDKQIDFIRRLVKYIEEAERSRMASLLLTMKQKERTAWLEARAAEV